MLLVEIYQEMKTLFLCSATEFPHNDVYLVAQQCLWDQLQ